MDYSVRQYLKVGVDYTAKGNFPGAKQQFLEIKKTAAEMQVEDPGKEEYWQEVETACSVVLKKIGEAGDDPNYPELGKEVKKHLENRLDMELPEIAERKLEKGRRRSERKERQERMQNRDIKDLFGGKSPPPSRLRSGVGTDSSPQGISYKAGVGEAEKTVDEDSTAEVVQDRVEFLEEEVRKSQEDLMELKQELDELRGEE